jgi:hypothetical protein
MPILSRRNIDPALFKKPDADFKARLREALQNPGLGAEERRRILAQLAMTGLGKVYRASTPPRPGAITFEDGAKQAP